MTIVSLKPRSTVIFENEQKSRFAPNELGTTVPADGINASVNVSVDGVDSIDGGVSLVNRQGWAPRTLRIIDDQSVEDDDTYALENDGVVNPPRELALVLGDVDDSITDYEVTIDGEDELGSPISEMFTFPGAGEVIKTANQFSLVTQVTGGPITGTFSGDFLRLGPWLGDTARDMVTGHPQESGDNQGENDPNTGLNDDNGSYLTAEETTDQEVWLTVPTLPIGFNVIDTVRVEWGTKNIGAPAGDGIEWLLDVDGVVTVVGNNDGTQTNVGVMHTSNFQAFSTLPHNSDPWSRTLFAGMKVGIRLKGENPTVEKRWHRVRIQVDGHADADGPLATGSTPHEKIINAISGDPFDENGEDDSYALNYGAQNTRLNARYPNLPSEAIGIVDVKAFWRASHVNQGEENGITERMAHCAKGGASASLADAVQPRGGNGLFRDWGPLEQSNVGGIRFGVQQFVDGSGLEYFGLPDDSGSSQGGDDRTLLGPGNPSGASCAFEPAAQDGQNIPWGTPFSQSITLLGEVNTRDPWTVAGVNSLETVFEAGSGNHLFRCIKTYLEPQWLRRPTGEVYFHLAVDDDPASPNDAIFMSSQHPDNKRFGVDFAGIEEVTAVNGLVGYFRAWKDPGATRGWKAKLNINGTDYEHPDGEQHNTSPELRTFEWLLSPATGEPFTRDEVNSAILIWEAQGENDYFPKFISLMGLDADIEQIPAKIDTARRLGSEVLLFQGKPVPYLQVRVPFELGNAKLMREMAVSHDAIPKVEEVLGFERWERSLLRVEEKAIDHDTDTFIYLLRDLRDVLRLLEFSGQAVTKGRSFDGMSIITPGVNPVFSRATNDYQPDPFADIIQELKANEPPTNLEGILIQNRGTNRVINSAFSQGAVDAFSNYTKVGLPAAGASIVEDPETIYDSEAGVLRSVLFTGADTPSDVYLEQNVILPTGESLTPEGGRHTLTITHEDISGQPLSMWLRGKPVGFAQNNFNPGDDSWATGNPTWFTLPVRSTPIRDRIFAPFGTLHDVGQTVGNRENLTVGVRFGVRTSANQQNRVYDLQIEGGTILSGEELAFPRSRILTKTGPVVRDEAVLYIPNRSAIPVYYTKRGTGFCVIETLWNSSELPQAAGVKRYIFGLPLTAGASDSLYYDADNEQFVYERIVGAVSYKATFFYPQVSAGVPIRLAWRWISVEGDREEVPFSTQLYVDDVRGTDASPGQAQIQPSLSNLYVGSFDGTDGQMLDGRIRRLKVSQEVLTLARIKKLR